MGKNLATTVVAGCLIFCAAVAAHAGAPASTSDGPYFWELRFPVTAKQASGFLAVQSGVEYDPGACGDLMVGPLVVRGRPLTAEEAWIELIKPHCPLVFKKEHTGIAPGVIADRDFTGAGDVEFNFSIDAVPRKEFIKKISEQANSLLLGYLSNDTDEELEIVGPLHGRMTVNAAIWAAMGSRELYARWIEGRMVSIEPVQHSVAYADMSKCRCNFGLPELWPPPSRTVTVTKSRLPSLEEHVQGRVVVFDRKQIEASGVASVPDLLRHATQLPYTRSRGFRMTGAQFAELRGLEPQYTLVLINGIRADSSASELLASAFDLNNVPISAVETIEVSAGSPSLVHGMDAIGGIVNIVLRHDLPTPFAEVRYGSASGGARERIGTVAAGTATDRTKTAFFLDYFETSELLGAQRDRWRNQDYTRYGGADRRSRFAAPANVYTLDGQDLPGLDAPEAAVSILPSGEITFRPGEINLTSPFAMQAIVPSMRRASFTGMAEIDLGGSKLSGEALLVHRHAHFQTSAEIVPGYTMAADHPQNSFDIPIAVDAALVGLPPPAIDSRSELLRGVVKLEGPIGQWTHHSFVRHSQEQALPSQVNLVDAAAVMKGLASADDHAISILTARPGEFAAASIIVPRQGSSSEASGTHISARIDGPLPFFRASMTLGVEYRTESARFDARVGQVQRHKGSAFSRVEIPIGERAGVTYGTRVDDFSDLGRIRREQWGLSWRPFSGIEFRAAYNEAFHAPSLYDLYFPRGASPSPMFDPQRQEVSSVNFIYGGNPDLEPTTGASSTLGFIFETDDTFKASVDLWRVRMRDRVSAVSPFALLANESTAIAGRVVRDEPTALDDQAGRPGRLLALDVSRANVGEVDARGVDLSIQRLFETSVGTFAPRVDVTYTDSFRFSDLPIRDAPMRDRTGIANVLGTIPSWRGTGSVAYIGDDWEFNVFARYRSSYRDYISAMDKISDREIPSRATWDLTVSKDVGAHIKLTIGISDVFDRAPAFAEVNEPAGVDMSQGDLTGRTAFIQIMGST